MECWLIWRPTRKSAVVYASRFVLGDAASPRKTRIALTNISEGLREKNAACEFCNRASDAGDVIWREA